MDWWPWDADTGRWARTLREVLATALAGWKAAEIPATRTAALVRNTTAHDVRRVALESRLQVLDTPLGPTGT
jgi:hypothetical protein